MQLVYFLHSLVICVTCLSFVRFRQAQVLFTVNDATGEVVGQTQNVIDLTTDADGSGPALCPPNFTADPATTAMVDELGLGPSAPDIVSGRRRPVPAVPRLADGATENRGGESTLGNLVAEVQHSATSTPEAGAAQIPS